MGQGVKKTLAAVAALSSLFVVASASADSVKDSWATGAPADPQWEAMAIPLLSADLVTVPEDMQPSALKLLAKRSIVAITPAQAAKMTGGAVPVAAPIAAAAAGTPAPAPAPDTTATTPVTTDASAPAVTDSTSTTPTATAAVGPASAAAPATPAPAAPPATGKLKPYLVRGVLLVGANGGFTAERRDDGLWIAYNGVSGTAPAALHRALVVFLPAPPAHLYITADYLN